MKNMDEDKKNNSLEVETQFGTLHAQVGGEPEYPGIDILLERDGQTQLIGVFESSPGYPERNYSVLHALLYTDAESDEFTYEGIFHKEQKVFTQWIEQTQDGTFSVRAYCETDQTSAPWLELSGIGTYSMARSLRLQIVKQHQSYQWERRHDILIHGTFYEVALIYNGKPFAVALKCKGKGDLLERECQFANIFPGGSLCVITEREISKREFDSYPVVILNGDLQTRKDSHEMSLMKLGENV